jgi:BirA family biotin operon repressor/biotin-[acetyl-CoA-carboxylase] ligase
MSDIQTNGRGQRNKTWQSGAFENLTFSATAEIKLWKINSLVDLNRLVALSLHRFFEELGFNPKIKWPNDIMIEDKKISGILIENFFRGDDIKSVIGIGINVNQKNFPIERATSILLQTQRQFQPKELLYKAIDAMNNTFNNFPFDRSEVIHEEYDKRLWKLNASHSFQQGNESAQKGTIIGTTETGDLIVTIDGAQAVFQNGTIRY